MQDPIRTKLARARIKLDAAEQQRDGDAVRPEAQRRGTPRRLRSWRALLDLRQKAADREEGERQKLLKGDPDSRCMFLMR